MAQSPAHKFGQIIGDMLEEAVRLPLAKVAKKHGLYLDRKHPRPARGDKRKVTWADGKDNNHDLDYVLEEGGSESTKGRPRAFIEIAYRRYAKHSRNKAQEVQGAIIPLAEKYADDHPFLGAVLAGVFTSNSIEQLGSHGFEVLYFSFDDIVEAFAASGVDAFFDEDSTDADVQAKIAAYEALSERERKAIPTALRKCRKAEVASFMLELEKTLSRKIEQIFILALHGINYEVASVADAIQVIREYEEEISITGFVRYEVSVRYSNGDEILGKFDHKREAVRFLDRLK